MRAGLIVAGIATIALAWPRSSSASASGDLSFDQLFTEVREKTASEKLFEGGLAAERLSKADSLALIEIVDINELGSWFSRGIITHKHVWAIFAVESGNRPSAINRSDPSGGAWGLGQVLAGTAIDYGISDPSLLLNPYIGASVSMRHMRNVYLQMLAGLGRPPKFDEFLQAYNVGVRGYLELGRRNHGYAWKVRARLVL